MFDRLQTSIFILFLQVGEFRAHAAEWTANVSAEFKETRRRLSVDIYDKFQRAASIKRKLSSELGINASINQEMTPGKRTLSANFCEDREGYPTVNFSLSPVPGALARNGSLYLNGLSPEYADRQEIAIIENLKWGAAWIIRFGELCKIHLATDRDYRYKHAFVFIHRASLMRYPNTFVK